MSYLLGVDFQVNGDDLLFETGDLVRFMVTPRPDIHNLVQWYTWDLGNSRDPASRRYETVERQIEYRYNYFGR